jgi:nitroreductase
MNAHPTVPLEFAHLDPEEVVARSRSLAEELTRRRSVRDFSSRAVPREVIENALAAAGSSPSGANLQPWHFVVVSDPTTKRRIRALAEEVERGFYDGRATEEWLDALEPLDVDADKPFLEEAPSLIVVFRRSRVQDERGRPRKTYYPIESVGIATGILIATLHLSGVATLPYTPSPMGFLADVLERSETDKPFLLLAVGFPKEGATVPALTREPLDRIATFVETG